MKLRLSRNLTRNSVLGKFFAAGFLFFLIKGLLWLGVGALAIAGLV